MPSNNFKIDRFDYLVLCLVCFGLVSVFSASFLYSERIYLDSYYMIKKQLFFVFVGILLYFIIKKLGSNFMIKYGDNLYLFFCVLLVCTLVPGLNSTINGSSRWVNFLYFKFLPAEFIKYGLVFASVKVFNFSSSSGDYKSLFQNLFLLFLPLVIFVFQPDFGSFSIALFSIFLVAFLSSFPRKYFYSLVVMAFISASIVLLLRPYRIKRLVSFLNPWESPTGHGFQIIQSYLAVANGGFWGVGIGNSVEKMFYLPESYSDFILSIVAEEFGLVAILVLVVTFSYLAYYGSRRILKIKDREKGILGIALLFTMIFQVIINMGVVLGLLPTKGLNLPLISYGGSSTLASLFFLGVVSSIIQESSDHALKISDKHGKN